MARKKPVSVLEETPEISVQEAFAIIAQAEQVIAEIEAEAVVDVDGSNGETEAVPETPPAPAPTAPKAEEFVCKLLGGHFKNANPWNFFTERIEFRGLMRTTFEQDMALVRAGVVCKRHVDAIRAEAKAGGVEAPWFCRLSDTLKKVEEREEKRAELKAEAEAERLELVRKRMAEQEAMRNEVGSYLKNLQADQERREEKLQRERGERRRDQKSFREKNQYNFSRDDGNGVTRSAPRIVRVK